MKVLCTNYGRKCAFLWTVLVLTCFFLYKGHSIVYDSFKPARSSNLTSRPITTKHSYGQSTRMCENNTLSTKPNMTYRQLKDKFAREEYGSVTQNPRDLWRTQYLEDKFSAEDDFARISQSYQLGGLFFLDDYKEAPLRDAMYPFEEEYFKYPPLTDMKSIICENYTTVEITNKTFQVGDRVKVHIRARDCYNQPRKTGGDEIRVWFKTPISQTIENRVAAEVTDLKNGSYLATGLLPWTGKLRLYVALAYPREHIRAVLYVQQKFKGWKMIVGKFENSKASEVTPCCHAPVVPGFSKKEICNKTKVNGSPWFCGRPLKKSLSCEDYKATRVVDLPLSLSMTCTDEENELLQRTERPPRMRMISSSKVLTVVPRSGQGSNKATPKQMCHSINPRKTWEPHWNPSAYALQGRWQSSLCTGLEMRARKCLENKHIISLGDSNTRGHYDALMSKMKCSQLSARSSKIWHKPLKAVCHTYNTVLSWHPHSQPFLSYTDRWTSVDDLMPSVHVLDQAPFDERQHWVIIHHYIHLSPFHLSVYESKYRAIKEALSRLLDRQPNVRVVIQGNHISWNDWTEGHFTAGDQLGKFVTQIQKEVFRDLQDRVFLVPFWDVTIAQENDSFHPNSNNYQTQIIFGYLCKE